MLILIPYSSVVCTYVCAGLVLMLAVEALRRSLLYKYCEADLSTNSNCDNRLQESLFAKGFIGAASGQASSSRPLVQAWIDLYTNDPSQPRTHLASSRMAELFYLPPYSATRDC